ncbi:DUF2809 domain-containing protein [Winogradskyella sp. 3972H.M.0a.05]|uniref:ribosomal maturation YjgA family protein n=1 Tax=Winogradskyella sp. 3972H.M.0a.05 TaxID=2950277 RepID=UPI003391B188
MKYLTFDRSYAIYAIILFLLEAWIAIIFDSGFIRHTFGDFLVVILLYSILKTFIDIKPLYMVITVLLIAFGIEFLQLTNLLEYLNLEHSYTAKLILGNTFHVSDLIAYTFGCITILIAEQNQKSYE